MGTESLSVVPNWLWTGSAMPNLSCVGLWSPRTLGRQQGLDRHQVTKYRKSGVAGLDSRSTKASLARVRVEVRRGKLRRND